MSHGRFISLIGLGAICVLASLLSIWIQVPIHFERPCRLFPQAEWLLLRSDPDTFEARLIDYRAGISPQVALYRFERGDVVNLAISPGIRPGQAIAARQEVGRLHSRLNQEYLNQLGPQLREAEANLEAARTGFKPEAIDQLRSQVAAAEARHRQFDTEHDRAAALWERGVISDAEYEQAAALSHETQAEAAAARSELRAAETGEKNSIIATWIAQVDLLRQQTADAHRRTEAERLLCPISGRVTAMQGDSALVRVADTDTLYALAPVSPSRARKLRAGNAAVLQALGSQGGSCGGEVVRIDTQASAMGGRTFFWVTVVIPDPGQGAIVGLRGTLRFRGEKVSLLAWLADQVSHAADRSLGV